MKRFALTFAAVLLLSPAAMAHEIETKPKPKLPSAEQIAQMQAQMPDFNKMLTGMKTLMEDPKIQKSMTSALGSLSEKMDDTDFKAKTEDGMPDLNALMGTMLSMMGDEAVMGEMLTAMEPMQNALPKIMEHAMPKAEAPISKP